MHNSKKEGEHAALETMIGGILYGVGHNIVEANLMNPLFAHLVSVICFAICFLKVGSVVVSIAANCSLIK